MAIHSGTIWEIRQDGSDLNGGGYRDYEDDAITANTLIQRIMPGVAGTVTGAGTGTEVFVYGGVTMTVTVDVDGNVSGVVFS